MPQNTFQPIPKPVKGQKGKKQKVEAQTALVLIEIKGGSIQTETWEGDADVCVIDWDNIKAGEDSPKNWEKFAHLRADLREEMEAAIAERG